MPFRRVAGAMQIVWHFWMFSFIHCMQPQTRSGKKEGKKRQDISPSSLNCRCKMGKTNSIYFIENLQFMFILFLNQRSYFSLVYLCFHLRLNSYFVNSQSPIKQNTWTKKKYQKYLMRYSRLVTATASEIMIYACVRVQIKRYCMFKCWFSFLCGLLSCLFATCQ